MLISTQRWFSADLCCSCHAFRSSPVICPRDSSHLASWTPNFVSQLRKTAGFLLSAFWLGSFLWAIRCGSFRVYLHCFPCLRDHCSMQPESQYLKMHPPPPHIFCLYLSYFRWEAQSGPCYSILIGNRSPYLDF